MTHPGKPPCDDAAIAHGPQALADVGPAARRWTLVAAILGSSLAFIDGTVVNVALPSIQRSLNASASDAQWVMESYALFLAALLLVGGALGDRFGRRRMFMSGVALFILSSLACALSRSAFALIASRGVQGVGAALLVPGSLALISATFPKAERGKAIGTWSAFSGITAAVGPVIGGFLVDRFSWTWAFLVNLPLGIAVIAVCFAKVPESRGSAQTNPIDWAGAVLATVGLAGVVFALIEAPSQGWASSAVIGSAGAGVVALVAFVVVESRIASPMLPIALFREPDFGGANLLTLLLYAALGGSLFFLPLDLIQVQGWGATAAGAALLPLIAIMFALSRWTGGLVDKVGSRLPLVGGPVIAAAGFALFALPTVGSGYWTTFFPAICVLGFGMSITVAPLTTTVMNSVGSELAGTASGVNNAVSRAAGLLAIAVFGIVLAVSFDARLDQELARLHLPPALSQAMLAQRHKLAGMVVPGGTEPAMAASLKQAVGVSFVAGFRRVMLLSAGLALLSAASAAWLIGGKLRPGDAAPRVP